MTARFTLELFYEDESDVPVVSEAMRRSLRLLSELAPHIALTIQVVFSLKGSQLKC